MKLTQKQADTIFVKNVIKYVIITLDYGDIIKMDILLFINHLTM